MGGRGPEWGEERGGGVRRSRGCMKGDPLPSSELCIVWTQLLFVTCGNRSHVKLYSLFYIGLMIVYSSEA